MKRAKRLQSQHAATKQVAASGGESHHTLDRAVTATSRWNDWFRKQGWSPFAFQRSAWESYLQGGSGLIHSSTGAGKTYAALGGPVLEWLQQNDTSSNSQEVPKLRLLWITPLRALAADTEGAIQAPIVDLNLPWRVETRTGDTSAKQRLRQKDRLPTVLITTPESLSLLLTRANCRDEFSTLSGVVVDEWHELLGTKRGVQLELCLARLRRWNPKVKTWGLSATLGDLPVAMNVLLGTSARETEPVPQCLRGEASNAYQVDAIIPEEMERFPWGGHLGLNQIEKVLACLDQARTALVFTNTRSQTEIWYRALLKLRPAWAGRMALHHGSLDLEVRRWVEAGLRTGDLRCVVCTSSLDLGVDFSPVDQVIQVGSPKGVGRLLQRAGRSGHQPGKTSHVVFVPTHAMELVEVASARDAMQRGDFETRPLWNKPLDVLAQHLVTLALGTGFTDEEGFSEVRTAHSYRDLSREEWLWTLDFIHRGGPTLQAYPDFRRVDLIEGRYVVSSEPIARRHRMSVGTISSDASVVVQYLRGKQLGTIEESFLSRLKPGEAFVFSGQLLELVKLHDLKAFVKPSKSKNGTVPRWQGGRLPLSSQLAQAMRRRLHEAHCGRYEGPEMLAVRPLLELQSRWSHIPAEGEVLMERLKTREGYHLFLYPFEGRLVHEGLANLLAERLSRVQATTFSLAFNDYGLELLSADPIAWNIDETDIFSECNLEEDILASLNSAEMAKRQFRDIARVAGLVFSGYPGAAKTARQLQASSSLMFEMFCEYDPDHLLLIQARREVLDQQLEGTRMRACLSRIKAGRLVLREIPRPTPMAFPLLIDRLREKLSSESLENRVRRLVAGLEKAAGPPIDP